MSFEIFDPTLLELEHNVKLAAEIQVMHAHNIANANTKNFIPFTFDEVLQQIVKRKDGKGLNLEEEMAAMARNNVKDFSYVKLMAAKINILRIVATQGRK